MSPYLDIIPSDSDEEVTDTALPASESQLNEDVFPAYSTSSLLGLDSARCDVVQ